MHALMSSKAAIKIAVRVIHAQLSTLTLSAAECLMLMLMQLVYVPLLCICAFAHAASAFAVPVHLCIHSYFMVAAEAVPAFAAIHKHVLPWLAPESWPARIQARFKAAKPTQGTPGPDGAYMPTEWASTAFEKAFGAVGGLKMHEWLLLAGPIGKFGLHGVIPDANISQVVFTYLDLLGSLWAKSFSRQQVADLVQSSKRLLADLEAYLPAYELNINRHMMQHLVPAIWEWGPPWVWSAFGFERLWGRMCEWLMNKTYPEASIHLGVRALQISLRYLASLADPSGVSYRYQVVSFDRETNATVLPGYLESSFHESVIMSDGGKIKSVVPTAGRPIKRDLEGVWVELHQFYLRWPEKCKSCECEEDSACSCPDYLALWLEYVNQDRKGRRITNAGSMSRSDIAKLLPGWYAWSQAQHKMPQQQQVCRGPNTAVELFDRCALGSVTLAGSKQEEKPKAKNSIVAIQKAGGGYDAGRVRRFFRHIPPGHDLTYTALEDEPFLSQIAVIDWFEPAARSRPENAKLTRDYRDQLTGIPVVRRKHTQDSAGNFWCCHQLVRCKFGLAAHPKRKGDMMLLSRTIGFDA